MSEDTPERSSWTPERSNMKKTTTLTFAASECTGVAFRVKSISAMGSRDQTSTRQEITGAIIAARQRSTGSRGSLPRQAFLTVLFLPLLRVFRDDRSPE